jgi:pumilio RNA-binding family
MSRPASHNAFGDLIDSTGTVDHESLEGLRSSASTPGLIGLQNHSFSAAVGSSLSRVKTPEPQVIGRPVGSAAPQMASKVFSIEKSGIGLGTQNGHSSSMTNLNDMVSSLSGLSLTGTRHAEQDSLLKSKLQMEVDNHPDVMLSAPNSVSLAGHNEIITNLNSFSSNEQVNLLKKSASLANLRSKIHSTGNATSLPGLDFTGHIPNAYHVNPKLNSVYNDKLETGLLSAFSFFLLLVWIPELI